MNDFTKSIAQALLNQDKIDNLLRKEFQQAVNDLLEVELTTFLGYDPYARVGWSTGNSRNGAYFRRVDTRLGEIKIQVSRDRNGMFHRHTLPDYKQHSNVLESMIIKLYSKGVTTREIADLIEKMYGSHYSPIQVSNVSKQMIPEIEAYRQRKFNGKFSCVYLGATYIPLRRTTFDRGAVYIAIDIKPNDREEVIDYYIAPNKNVENWAEILQGMESRGLEQVKLFLSDSVVGMKAMLEQTHPKIHFQRCLVHVIRNICAKVHVDNHETIMSEFRQVHQQPNKEATIKVLHAFYDKWNRAYNHAIRNLKEIEPDLLVFYSYPKRIGASIYSTNMIESFDNVIKRKVEPETKFPVERSLNTFIGAQTMNYNERYSNQTHKGFGQVQDTLESYSD